MIAATLLSGLAIGAIYSLIAIGFSLIFRATGLINFAQGEMVTIGAMIGYTMVSGLGLPFGPAFIVAMLGGAVVSLLMELLIFRTMRRWGMPEINLIIATVGLILIFSNGAKFIWGAQALSYAQSIASGVIRIGPFALSNQSLAIFGIGLLIMVALQLFFQRTRPGRAMRAAASDPTMAALAGIDVNLTHSATALFSGAVGAAAGALLAPMYYASYDMGVIAFKAFSAAILGGFGSILGAMVGGLLVGELETLGSIYVSSEYKDAIAYGLIIVLLLVRPTGLFGRSVWRST